MLDVRPITEAMAGFVGLICSLFSMGIMIWCIVALIDLEISSSMRMAIIILMIGYGITFSLYRYIKRTLE